ncbi:TetR/AcrR family transcriptional regulator [Radiobacillus kanasensis]|uniref:TetR/AcrR family transcriptional regulator n=1 Tax=Radiobacillus kanasensis TaxID=2844358 RepID=UPI001E2CD414|nr:TetR/AcrR family transcriptional regulator [Radiobacillus kanasensis]UFU00282.1 TetR/AcrR family transcriptional regulator [Radiobacillus kanasensis]
MDGYTRRTEQKKAVIIGVATEKLRIQSYKLVTIKQLADEAGVSQVTIYNYFGSKDELLFAAIERLMDDKLDDYQIYLEREQSYPALVSGIMFEEQSFVKELYAYMGQAANRELIQRKVQAYQDAKLVPFLLNLIRKGFDKGYISRDLTEMDIMFYFNMYQRELNRIHTEKESTFTITEEKLIDFFFHGIMGE